MLSYMHTKRFNTFFFKWLQSRFGAIPRLLSGYWQTSKICKMFGVSTKSGLLNIFFIF